LPQAAAMAAATAMAAGCSDGWPAATAGSDGPQQWPAATAAAMAGSDGRQR
jgi:hypothetical protein